MRIGGNVEMRERGNFGMRKGGRMVMPIGGSLNANRHSSDGKFNFSVEISYPLIGLIVSYRGWLVSVRSCKRPMP